MEYKYKTVWIISSNSGDIWQTTVTIVAFPFVGSLYLANSLEKTKANKHLKVYYWNKTSGFISWKQNYSACFFLLLFFECWKGIYVLLLSFHWYIRSSIRILVWAVTPQLLRKYSWNFTYMAICFKREPFNFGLGVFNPWPLSKYIRDILLIWKTCSWNFRDGFIL